MDNLDDRQQAGEYLRLALKFIAKYNLVTNLVNLNLFYAYAEGKSNVLNQAVDGIIKGNGTITADQAKQLYDNFLVEGHKVFAEKLLVSISKILEELSVFFADSIDDMSDYGSKVGGFVKQVSEIEDYDEIDKIVDKMLVETKTLIILNKKTQSQIQSSSEEIDVLKTKLEKVQHEAHTDTLTLLLNRRGFEKTLLLEKIKAMENSGAGFSIMMIDVDNFKQVNDTYGHLTGDSVLKSIAEIFKKHLRKDDFAARIGGDEFCLVMSQTNLLQSIVVAVKIKNRVENISWKLKQNGDKLGGVTLSIGIAQYAPHESEEELINRADKALYLAKESGRNTVKTQQDL